MSFVTKDYLLKTLYCYEAKIKPYNLNDYVVDDDIISIFITKAKYECVFEISPNTNISPLYGVSNYFGNKFGRLSHLEGEDVDLRKIYCNSADNTLLLEHNNLLFNQDVVDIGTLKLKITFYSTGVGNQHLLFDFFRVQTPPTTIWKLTNLPNSTLEDWFKYIGVKYCTGFEINFFGKLK